MNDAEGLLLEAERRARRTSPPPALGTHRYREPRIPLGCRFPRLAFHSLIHGINFNNKNLAGKHRCVARAPSGKAKEVLVGGWRADCQLICYLSSALDLTTAAMVYMVASSLLPGGVLPSNPSPLLKFHPILPGSSSATNSQSNLHSLHGSKKLPQGGIKTAGDLTLPGVKETREPSTFPVTHENHHFFVSGATSLLLS